jgi:nucleoside-diphosphate-sugar epimerase
MSVFITGTTGYVGKHLLRYLLLAGIPVTICIRPKKGVSGKQRFIAEIANDALFIGVPFCVRIVEKDVSDLVESDLAGCHTIIHCAANVKFTSPLELLMKENVHAVQNIHKISKGLRFVHISTCYVHPKTQTIRKPVKISDNLQRSDFICNYAYTKYLAEEYLYSQDGNIDIIRLSCVGSPLENLPPMRGGAHLSIIEAILRRTIPDFWVPSGFKFSVVPVDIVAKEIVKHICTPRSGLQILQFCAPRNSKTYNFELLNILNTIDTKGLTTLWSNMDFEEYKARMKSKYWLFPSACKRICDTNEVISYVSDNIDFESSIDLPEVGYKNYISSTFNYINLLILTRPTNYTFTAYIQALVLSVL